LRRPKKKKRGWVWVVWVGRCLGVKKLVVGGKKQGSKLWEILEVDAATQGKRTNKVGGRSSTKRREEDNTRLLGCADWHGKRSRGDQVVG